MQTSHPLDGVHMNALARERAKAQMQRAEFLIELVAQGVSKMRHVTRMLKSDVKYRFVTNMAKMKVIA